MELLVSRLVEIALAMVLAGLVLLVFNGLTVGSWQGFMLLIVPLGTMWSMYLGAMVAVDVSKGLFLLITAMTVLAVYLIARFAKPRPLRVAGETLAFVGQQVVLMYLFAIQGISG